MEIKVYHYRKTAGGQLVPSWDKDVYVILPRGGETMVRVFDDDGTTVSGIARCSDKDNYNKRLGRTIALGRALKRLREANNAH